MTYIRTPEMKCNKRQKIIENDVARFRCIHRDSGVWGQTVTDEACALCPLSVKRSRCGDKPTEPEKKEMEQAEEQLGFFEEVDKTPDGEPVPEFPALTIQAWMYKEALLKWKRAGYPTRTQEEVTEILETHCKPCSWYDASAKRCKGCGCRVTDGAVAVVNKIKMATEHCPKEIW